jgi:hypothetical protein
MKLVKLNDVVGVFCQDEEKQRDLIGEFVLNKYPNELTQKAIVSDLKQFSLWLKEKFQKSVFEVKAYELGVYRKHLINLGYAVGSVNRKLLRRTPISGHGAVNLSYGGGVWEMCISLV